MRPMATSLQESMRSELTVSKFSFIHLLLGPIWIGVLANFAAADSYKPQYCELSDHVLVVQHANEAFRWDDAGQGGSYKIQLLVDADQAPMMFFTSATMPVCDDNVCQSIQIDLYWDLVGNYVGYGTPKGQPLLKHDDIPFDRQDGWKLHQILLDQNSILGQRPIKELIDSGIQRTPQANQTNSAVVDGWSGATSKEIADAVVGGALYSCHTIWRFAHRCELSGRMQHHLESVYGPEIKKRLLESDRSAYQVYSLKRMEELDYQRQLPRVLQLFRSGPPSVCQSIISRTPEKIWQSPELTQTIYSEFVRLNVDQRTVLIERLSQADRSATECLGDHIESMSKSQLTEFLSHLTRHPEVLGDSLKHRLEQIVSSEQYAYCYVIDDFLRSAR